MDDQADPKLDAVAIAKAAEQCFLLSMSDDLTPDQQREMNTTGKQLRVDWLNLVTAQFNDAGRDAVAAANAQLAEITDLLAEDKLRLAGYVKVMAKVNKVLGGLDALLKVAAKFI